jgi:c-di-GMP phosphodiesterase
MQALVARQPVFDRDLKVVAYELLFRGEVFPAGDVASASVLSDAFFGIGWKELVGDRPALINIPGELLCDDRLALLPTRRR